MCRNASWKMKSSTLLLALGAIIPAPAAGLAPGRPNDGSSRVVGLDLYRQRVPDPVANDARRLRRRAGTVNAILDNSEILYFLNGTLGNPPQSVRMHLDTGSSDLWVNTPISELCSSSSRPCAASGTYNANSSSTSKYVGSFFNISYVDGSGASGDYVTDIIRLFGSEVRDFQFGVGYISSSPQSVLGIGYPANEASVARLNKAKYPNLPTKMVSDGLINSATYSLYLNDVDAQTGMILFGGVDKARFKAPLVTLPIQKSSSQFMEFYITMTGLSMGQTQAGSNMALAVLLDSGSSFTYLPNAVVEPIYQALNAGFSQKDGVAYVPCSMRDQDVSLTFRFSDPAVIDVPLRELIIDPKDLPGGRSMTFRNGKSACYCGILPSENPGGVLGDTFLRSAYVVYDMKNNQISLAPTVLNASGSDVEEIGPGADGVPQAVMARNPVPAASGLPPRSSRNGNGSDSGAAGVAAPPLVLVVLTIALGLLVGFAGFVV